MGIKPLSMDAKSNVQTATVPVCRQALPAEQKLLYATQ